MNSVAMWADEPSENADLLGSPATFVDFYRSDRATIVRAIAMSTGDEALAAEAVDEAMTRAYARWGSVQRLDNPAGWVFQTALNWSRTQLRRRGRPVRAPQIPQLGPEPSAPEPAIDMALRELSDDHRAVVVCRYLLGWSEAMTASALGIRPGTAKSRLSRATQILQSRLAHLAPEGRS